MSFTFLPIRRFTMPKPIQLAISALLIAGCTKSSPPGHLIIAIDVSDQDKTVLLRYAATAYQCQSSLATDDQLTVYIFGHDYDLVYDGPRIAGRGAFNDKIGAKLNKPRLGLVQPGTRTAAALTCLTTAVKDDHRSTCLVLETDGGIEALDQAVRSQILTSAKELNASPNLNQVAVVGVSDRWRQQWITWLTPLGKRAAVRGKNDFDSMLAWRRGK